ncbi:MAG: hypothetical protein LCH84_19240 [Gemmatimonadetes bacterium]|nr:hypothetical protein [Gemmatimonadota bacterium]
MRRIPLPVFAFALIAAAPAAPAPQQDMSFFITSAGSGNGGDLGGLEGADRHCAMLAEAAGVRGKTWRAYLSTAAMDGKVAVNARDRIGKGPWKNAKGVVVATSVDDLHSENAKLGKEHSLTEKGMPVNGRGDTPNTHDILTGSGLDGRMSTDGSDNCRNWTSSDSTGGAWVGHHDRNGGGANPTSWNSAHKSRGCSQRNLVATGGAGLYYCFAQ